MDSHIAIIFALVVILIIYLLLKPNKDPKVAPYQPPNFRVIDENGLLVEKVEKNILGRGAFGIVYSGELCGQKVAVKMLKDGDTDKRQIENFKLEINCMKKINEKPHKNIIQLLCCRTQGENLYAVLEYASQGDIGNFLKSNHPQSSPEDLLSYAKQVAQGMKHLHEKCSLIHRDLAARNILVVTDNSGDIMKIADFGFSIDIQISIKEYYEKKNKLSKHKVHPVGWMAPEALKNNYTFESDVWSYGVLLWEIYSHGQRIPRPFDYHQLEAGERLDQPPGCSDSVYKLMKKCWEFVETKRPTFQEVIIKIEQVFQEILTGNVI